MRKLTAKDIENENIFKIGGGLKDISFGVYPVFRKYSDSVKVAGSKKATLYSWNEPFMQSEPPYEEEAVTQPETTTCSGVLIDVLLPEGFEIYSNYDASLKDHLLLSLTKVEIENLHKQLTMFIENGGL